ncbi:MAG: hypothetical protein ABI388_00185 [Bacteroidia bacterium]
MMKLINSLSHKLKDTLWFRIALVLCGILLIIYRTPDLLINPRIWAEEGTIFYAFARHHSVWQIFTTAHVGYLTLFNSVVSSLQAKLVEPEYAATISTYMGLLVQITPVYIIAFTSSKFWDNAFKKIICAFIVIIVMEPELWLNTTNSHFIFGLITFLIMVISASDLSNFQKYFFRLLLFIGGLTGPASIFFTPTFLVKAYREKSKEKYIQAGIITLCAIIQACIILYSIFFDNKYKRLAVHDLKTTRYHFIIDNFSLLPHTYPFHYHLLTFDLITLFGIFIGAFYGYLILKNIKKIDYLIPLLSVTVVGIFSTLGSLDMSGGTRYSYIPTCILMLVFLSEALDSKSKSRYVASLILIVCLACNASCYKRTLTEWAYSANFPKWKNEIAKWRIDSTYTPRTHPAFIKDDEWQVKM